MKRLRIAYAIIHANRREGQARPIAEVAERLARKHEVHLFARTVADIDLTGINWHRMPGPGWPAFADLLSYYLLAQQKVRGHEFDIVHAVGMIVPAANVIAIQNVQIAKRSFMKAAGAQFGPLRRLSHWLYDRLACEAERRVYTERPGRDSRRLFLPVSRGVGRELNAHYDIGSAAVCVIPNAADAKVFKPLSSEEKAAWRRANGFEPSDVVIAFAGGEWARKGLEFALGALGRIREDNVKLLVLGTDPEAARFHQLACRLGVQDRVVFAGFRRDIAQGLGASDLFVFPSRYEAFSLVTLEAAACGLPVLASRINGTEEFIRPGQNGFFIEHDPEQISRTLQPLLRSGELRRAMGQAARRSVEDEYTWDRVADATEAAYLQQLDPYQAPANLVSQPR